MSDIPVDKIKKMLELGRASDLVKLMEGESEYSSDSKDNIPVSKEELYTYSMALEHVRFVEKYGLEVGEIEEAGKVYVACPEYFDSWLSHGAKGVEYGEIYSYLEANPI